MKMAFDFDNPNRYVEFTYSDGKEYRVRKFDSLSLVEINEIGGNGTANERAYNVASTLFEEAGLPKIEEMPQDFVVELLKAMQSGEQ